MDPVLQSGVFAYRAGPTGQPEILLVKKHRSVNWGICKGKIEKSLSPQENAAKEAFEEAGVKGNIQQKMLGSYRAMKRDGEKDVLIEVQVYLFEVTKSADDWPEKDKRLVQWYAPDEAAKLLREPLLVALCQKLATGGIAALADSLHEPNRK
jgi:8-oxo-dGTP pyrophosphatase MutT (NUDIX family)